MSKLSGGQCPESRDLRAQESLHDQSFFCQEMLPDSPVCRHVDVVSYLLQMGADPLVPDKVHSRTCLHYAAWNGELAPSKGFLTSVEEI